nr:hypothetical protein [Clostridia bacterium]
VYYFTKKYYPELYPRIKEYVRQGRWEITGSAWVEADTNIASGESLIRQLLYGREFFMKEFGFCSDIYWLPDCFGFTAALPQIIRRSGMKYFMTSKLTNNDTNEFPVSVFRWRAHSGDEVLAYMQKMSYNGVADAGYITELRRKNRQNDVVPATLGCFGYGDGGGGCTYEMVEHVRAYQKTPGMPEVRIGRADEFFAEAEKARNELPVWDGEMYYENHRGTYTSQAFVKQNNRRGEYLLADIEQLGVFAGGYDREAVEELWRTLLTNQFHDILPGTSIHEVFENTRGEYRELFEKGSAIKSGLLGRLAAEYAGENTVFVWNFLAHPVKTVVRVRVPAAFTGVEGETCEATACGDFSVIEFKAELPAAGFRVFRLTTGGTAEAGVGIASELKLENELLRVRFAENGDILSVYDKENDREVLSGRGNRLSVSHDKPVHESAWNLENDYKLHMDYLDEVSEVTVASSTPNKGVIRVVRRYHDSVITQSISLRKGERRLDFATHTDWREREKVLKAEFPLNVRSRYSTFNIAHGAVERPTFANNEYETAMFECCAHKWVDLSESCYGAAVLNDCKYGYDVSGDLLRITLMRGPVCPDVYGDIGEQDFTYSLYPHDGEWHSCGLIEQGELLNNPPAAIYCGAETGRPSSAAECSKSFIRTDLDNVSLEAVKTAQDGCGIIVRVNETAKKRVKASLKLAFKAKRCFECNMMEENETELPAGDEISFELKPFEVRTFRIVC